MCPIRIETRIAVFLRILGRNFDKGFFEWIRNSGLRPSLCKGWVAGPRREHDRIWHENKKRTKKQKSTWNPIFSKIAHNSLNNGRRAVLIPFLDFQYFWTFWWFLLIFCYHFFWKNHQVSEGRRLLLHQEIFDPFSAGEITLIFSKFENS